MTTVYVGLGSNLGDRTATVRGAADALDAVVGLRLGALSRLHLTAPVGGPPQPHFVNAVARLECALPPAALLRALQRIEAHHRRRRGVVDGPRTLDLDLLLYGAHRVELPGLTVPHPRMAARRFVLDPLAELAPRLRVPGAAAAAAAGPDREVAA